MAVVVGLITHPELLMAVDWYSISLSSSQSLDQWLIGFVTSWEGKRVLFIALTSTAGIIGGGNVDKFLWRRVWQLRVDGDGRHANNKRNDFNLVSRCRSFNAPYAICRLTSSSLLFVTLPQFIRTRRRTRRYIWTRCLVYSSCAGCVYIQHAILLCHAVINR